MPESTGLPAAASQAPTTVGLDRQVDHAASITAGYALLCCFGGAAEQSVSGRQLRRTLVGLGYRPVIARHLVRTSPLLTRERRDSYRLRPFHA